MISTDESLLPLHTLSGDVAGATVAGTTIGSGVAQIVIVDCGRMPDKPPLPPLLLDSSNALKADDTCNKFSIRQE